MPSVFETVYEERENRLSVGASVHTPVITAEKSISTFNDHFIAGLASVNPKISIHLWCRLLPQAFLTLNLLRQSRINPKLTAYAHMHGQPDYNRNSVAPPGIQVYMKRATTEEHGYYMGWKVDT